MDNDALSSSRAQITPRKPPRCTKCDGRPLRSQCKHTVQGRQHILACNGRNSSLIHHTPLRAFPESPSPVAQRAPRICYICPGLPPQSECLHTAKGRKIISARAAASLVGRIEPPAARHSTDTETPLTVPSVSPPVAPSTQIVKNRAPNMPFPNDECLKALADTPTLMSMHHLSELASSLSKGVIDCSLETPIQTFCLPHPQNQVPESLQPVHDDLFSPARDPDSNHLQNPCSESPYSTLPLETNIDYPVEEQSSTIPDKFAFLTPTKQKATQSNPIHGMVVGAQRGNTLYKIHRTKQLPSSIDNSRIASQRFSRLVNKILEKCEALSQETGAWVFLGAQHISARGGAISYASPRLCREANSEASQLATQFNHTVSELLRARRADALVLQRQLEEAQVRNKEAERQQCIQQAMLDAYRERFGEIE